MALRETRASWKRLLFFFVCISVGVAAIVALRSVIQDVRGVFGREARALNAADVREKLFNQGIETVGGTPEEFVAYNKAESAKWGRVIREQGIKIE